MKNFFSCFAVFLIIFFTKQFLYEHWHNISWINEIILPSFVFGVITSYLLPVLNKNMYLIKKINLKKILIFLFLAGFLFFSIFFIKDISKQKIEVSYDDLIKEDLRKTRK